MTIQSEKKRKITFSTAIMIERLLATYTKREQTPLHKKIHKNLKKNIKRYKNLNGKVFELIYNKGVTDVLDKAIDFLAKQENQRIELSYIISFLYIKEEKELRLNFSFGGEDFEKWNKPDESKDAFILEQNSRKIANFIYMKIEEKS